MSALEFDDEWRWQMDMLGRSLDLGYAMHNKDELGGLIEQDTAFGKVVEIAACIQNASLHHGVHDSHLVVGARELVSEVPMMIGEDRPVTQFDARGLEDLGHVVVDLVPRRYLSLIKALRSLDPSVGGQLDALNLHDEHVYELFVRGDTAGVFHFGHQGVQGVLQELRPERFDHLMAAIALYRPGPMEQLSQYIARRHGRGWVSEALPIIQTVAEDTYGLLIYQEQLVELLQELGGYTLAEADLLRKAIGKKRRDIMSREKARVVEGCLRRGMEEVEAEKVWIHIQPLCDYSFSKAHAVCSAMVAYKMAWLKLSYRDAFEEGLHELKGVEVF